MPKIYVYTRVSTPDQADAIAMQNRVALAHKDYVISRDTAENNGVQREWQVIGPLEEKESAFKRHFQQRPIGKWLCENLQQGDHLVFARFDRYVRLTKDHILQTEEFTKRGITVHFADLNVTIGTAAGDMITTFFAAIAQYYSQSLSERMKASYRERYVYGTKVAPRCSALLETVSRGKGLPDVQVVNRQSISYLRYVMIVRLRHLRETGRPLSWDGCADALEEARVRHGDLAEYRPPSKRRDWRSIQIVKSLRTIRTTQLPPLRGARITQSLIHGPDPFAMGHAPSQNKVRNARNTRRRDSMYQHYRQLVADNKITDSRSVFGKRTKRWSIAFDCCQQCGGTNNKHFAKGLCRRCYDAAANRAAPLT